MVDRCRSEAFRLTGQDGLLAQLAMMIGKVATRRQVRDAEVVDDHHRSAGGPQERGHRHDVARCTVGRLMREPGWREHVTDPNTIRPPPMTRMSCYPDLG